MAFWNKKTTQDLRRKRLMQIERDRIGQHEHLDYHYAMVAMQDEQIARLKEEIAANEPGAEKNQAWKNPAAKPQVPVFSGLQSAQCGLAAFGAALRKLRGDLEVPERG